MARSQGEEQINSESEVSGSWDTAHSRACFLESTTEWNLKSGCLLERFEDLPPLLADFMSIFIVNRRKAQRILSCVGSSTGRYALDGSSHRCQDAESLQGKDSLPWMKSGSCRRSASEDSSDSEEAPARPSVMATAFPALVPFLDFQRASRSGLIFWRSGIWLVISIVLYLSYCIS